MDDLEQAIISSIALQKALMERIEELSSQLLECRCDAHQLAIQNSLLQTAIGFDVSTQAEIQRLQALVREQQKIIDQLQAEKEQNSPSD